MTSLLDRAVNLFTFLAKREEISSAPTRDLSSYEREGTVRWLHSLPEEAWSSISEADPDHVLTVPRPPTLLRPRAEDDVKAWLSGPLDDPMTRPAIVPPMPVNDVPQERAEPDDDSSPDAPGSAQQPDSTAVPAEVLEWLEEWDRWAEEYPRHEKQKKLYKEFFELYDRSTQDGDTVELILGVGLLGWDVLTTDSRAQGRIERIRRHLLTVPLQAAMDPEDGAIRIELDPARIGVNAEVDMIPATGIADQSVVRELSDVARAFEGSVLDREAVAALLRDFVHRFHAEGDWTSIAVPPAPEATPVVSWSPAVILRPRRRAGLAQALQSIADKIEEKGQIPAGVATLLDPDRVPPVQRDSTPGAVLTLDEEVFSPLPLNDMQRRIIENVDAHAQTLVQGPPGTGKTHTAAALISHLLAQGKRVLITAETERALVEIRGKLPEQIKPLAVSVVGNGREEMAELRTAVDTIADKSTSHDRDEAHRRITSLLIDVDRLRVQRRALSASLVEAREVDVAVHHRGHYEGTLARIAECYQEEAADHGWIREYVPASADLVCPLTPEELERLQRAMQSATLPPDLQGRQGRRPDMTTLCTPEEFSDLVSNLKGAEDGGDDPDDPLVRARVAALDTLSVDALDALRETALALSAKLGPLSGSREPWVSAALADVLSGFDAPWRGRHAATVELIEALDAHLARLGATTVAFHEDPARLAALSRRLLDGLGVDARLKTTADGSVKVGMFAPAVVKECRELFDAVRVDGLPPSTGAHFAAVADHYQAQLLLEKIDQLWEVTPLTAGPPVFRARRDAHHGRAQLLARALELGLDVREASTALRSKGGVAVKWTDPGERRSHLDALQVSRRRAVVREMLQPLQTLENHAATLAQWKDAAGPVHDLLEAVRARDVSGYKDAHDQLVRLKTHGDAADERDRLLAPLRVLSRRLADAFQGSDPEGLWLGRVTRLTQAFDWLALGPWVAAREMVDVNQVQEQITRTDEQLRQRAEEIAALRAWNHAVSPERLTLGSRADLRGYSQLVRKLGKGTGKYADRRRGQIREAMERCRPSVPVWIMPLYRVTEQFGMEEQMFDVVIVDEASQAGAEAVFLQYLAPKIVVIGDDKQVTPSAVGTRLEDIQELAGRYLQDHPSRPYWEDPQRSLFDEALQRYGGQLPLTEHRRCVPEIIEFSNQIAYRPENIELVPVRQFGADRLEPFVVTHVKDGFEEGRSSHRVNRAEARALVDDLRACLDDPRYADKTMAVISLGGPAQVKILEALVMEEIPADKIARHKVRVGLPPSFQGSERDVIFLSLVTGSHGKDRRIQSQTSEQYVQRFNVAVSRARDQIRLFHTAALGDFTNKEDLRFRLLDYAYGVVRRGRSLAPGESPFVSDTERQEPFDSLFEQRVYNQIVGRGYTVQPQLQALGYSLDLVVIGPKSRLAVECDGDHWHGPEQYKDDLRRQRDLERCGWTIFRIRESIYYLDPQKALEPLWDLLEQMNIRPSGWLEDAQEKAESAIPSPSEEGLAQEGGDTGVLGEDRTDPDVKAGHASTEEDSSLPEVTGSPESEVDPVNSELTYGQDEISEDQGAEEHPIDTAPAPGAPSPGGHALTEERARAGELYVIPEPSPADIQVLQTPRSSAKVRGTTMSNLVPYPEFTGSTTPVQDASQEGIKAGLLSILEVEGPALGSRLMRVYVTSSGFKRLGWNMEYELRRALEALVSGSRVVSDNPLRESLSDRTFRLPDQNAVVLRSAGPRSIRDIPPREIATHMAQIITDNPTISRDMVYRKVLDIYGLKRLTDQIRWHLDPIYDHWKRRQWDVTR